MQTPSLLNFEPCIVIHSLKISLDNHGFTDNFVAVIVLFFFLFEGCSNKSFTMIIVMFPSCLNLLLLDSVEPVRLLLSYRGISLLRSLFTFCSLAYDLIEAVAVYMS